MMIYPPFRQTPMFILTSFAQTTYKQLAKVVNNHEKIDTVYSALSSMYFGRL